MRALLLALPPRRVRLVLSIASAAALMLAALRPALPWWVRPRWTVVVDVSKSVDRPELAATLEPLARRLPRSTRWVAFADGARVLDSFEQLQGLELDPPAGDSSTRALATTASDLAGALEVAATTLGPEVAERQAQVLLLSDGLATRGDARTAAARLAEHGVELWSLPLRPAPPPASVVGLEAETLQAGSPGVVRATVVSPIAQRASFELALSSGLLSGDTGDIEQDITTELLPGLNTVEVTIEPKAQGLQRLSLVWHEQAGTTPASGPSIVAQRRQAVEVHAPRSALLVEGGPALDALAQLLREKGWRIQRTRPQNLAAMRSSFENRDSFDAVLLDDVEASTLTPDVQDSLHRWVVELGGGLVFASGPQTYGKDGYQDTPLEEILPLRFNVEEERPDVALMIAFDKSYSMRGEAIELAKEATKAVVDELADEHRFGVVAFDWNPTLVVPLQTLTDRAGVRDAISRIEAGAQTNFLPALEACYEQLRTVDADVEHVILLSDGKTYPDDYEKLVGAMYKDGITVSTVAIGGEADRTLLGDIAGWGHGEAYAVEDAGRVQQILLDEARSRVKDTFVERSTPLHSSEVLPPLDARLLDDAPPIAGYEVLDAHPRAEVLLESDDDDHHPLLARRNVGLGRVWMLATDLDGRWSAPWLRWSRFGDLLSSVLGDAAGSALNGVDLRLVERDGWLALDVQVAAVDVASAGNAAFRAERNGLDVALREGPAVGAGARRSPLHQVAPGCYRRWLRPVGAALDATSFEREAWLEVEGRTVGMVDLDHWAKEEQRPEPADLELLSELATRTGGGVIDASESAQVEALVHARAWRRVSWWPALAALGLALYLAELALRRGALLQRLQRRYR